MPRFFIFHLLAFFAIPLLVVSAQAADQILESSLDLTTTLTADTSPVSALTARNDSCCVVMLYDNMSGTADIADLVYYVDFMFNGGNAPICFDQADCNGDCQLDITNLTCRICWFFGDARCGAVDCHVCP
ncbi:MAG: hypothetical protein P1R58_06830 [bacterium]|nr:hypothetical protein [bacterium]